MLIKGGRLGQYKRPEMSRETREVKEVDDETRPQGDAGPFQIAYSVTRPEDFKVPKTMHEDLSLFTHSRWERFPTAMIISEGGDNKLFVKYAKRKFDELIEKAPFNEVSLEQFCERSEPITFYLEELPCGAPNSHIPLLIKEKMKNFEVHQILVDGGSFVDVMYTDRFCTIQLDESHMSPYVGFGLQRFNGSTS